VRHTWFLLLILAACSRAPQATGPVGSANPEASPDGRTRIGNGGDDNALRDNAWFAGDKSIRVCLESEKGTEKPVLDEAFAVWDRYFSEKKLNDRRFFPERGALSLGLKHEWVECTDSPDLRIVIGATSDSRLNWERLNEFAGKSAFVIRRSYDEIAAWGRGDMWISASRLQDKFQTEAGKKLWLLGHAVHELGHVLGCGHVSGTILAEDFFQPFEKTFQQSPPESYDSEKARANLFWPDQKRELLTCVDCPVRVTYGYTHTHWDYFVLLFGVEALHQVSPAYYIDLSKAGPNVPFEIHFGSDSAPEFNKVLSLGNEKLEEITRGDLPLFKVSFREAAGGDLQTYASFQASLRYRGTLVGRGDKGEAIAFPVEIQRNTPAGAMVFSLPDVSENWLTGLRTGPLPSKEKIDE